jgi:type IV secretory pathway VirB3-like protein
MMGSGTWWIHRRSRGVPLSDEENKILGEIERQLTESDPQFVRDVGRTTVYSQSIRGLKFATLGLVVGAVVMLATLQAGFLYAFIGFLIMFVAALSFERHARKLGRSGLEQMTQGIRPANGGPTRGNRLRQRLRRNDEFTDLDDPRDDGLGGIGGTDPNRN